MNIRQSLICVSSIVLFLLFATHVQASNAQVTDEQVTDAQASKPYRVGEIIKGKEYNDGLKRWVERDFSIWVDINDSGHKYIAFMAETGLDNAIVSLDYNITLRNEFGALIEKAIEWSDVARQNNADTSRALGCFGGPGGADRYNMSECKNTGTPPERGRNEIGLKFFAAQEGQQTNLILNIAGNDGASKVSLYLDQVEMEKLLMNMHQIEETFEKAIEKAKKTEEQQKLFK